MPIEEFVLTNFPQSTLPLKKSLAKVFSGPIEIRPLIVVSNEFFMVKRKNRWYRLGAVGLVSLLKKVTVIHFCNRGIQDDSLIFALRWSNTSCRANGYELVSKICSNALQQELDRENVRSTGGLINSSPCTD